MSDDRRAGGRPQLGGLVQRARERLGGWTDSTVHDPGVTLLEVLAYALDQLSGYADRIAGEAHLGSARRRGSRGRTWARLAIEVDGQRWQRVPDLASSAAEDRHYVVRDHEGATVVEFGDGVHGRRPASGSTIGVRYRAGGGYTTVLLQQGRVVLDRDRLDTQAVTACGVYAGIVVDDLDPWQRHRLQLRVPELTGDLATWAMACLPPGSSTELPVVGDPVWVAFEGGDPSRPVWLGRRPVG